MAQIEDKDLGFKKLMTTFQVNDGESAAFIGVLESAGTHQPKKNRKGSPVSVAEIAAVHEFGSTDGTIPERSFMRSSVDANERRLEQMLTRFAGQVMDGSTTPALALGIAGQFVKQEMQKRITNQGPGMTGAWKPLSKQTIAEKGSSQALIDTGQLRQSIQTQVILARSQGEE